MQTWKQELRELIVLECMYNCYLHEFRILDTPWERTFFGKGYWVMTEGVMH